MKLRYLINDLKIKFKPIDEILHTPNLNGPILNLNLFGLYLLISDNRFRQSLFNASWIHIDGIGASLLIYLCTFHWYPAIGYKRWGHKIFNKFNDRSFLLIGGSEDESLNALQNLSLIYPNISISSSNGYNTDNTYFRMIDSFPDSIIIVGMGMPKQEIFISTAVRMGYANVFFACGGWIKQLARREKPVPAFFYKLKLEWLYRSVGRPGHFKNRVLRPLLCIIKNF